MTMEGGSATVAVLAPPEDIAASTLFSKSIDSCGGAKVGKITGNSLLFQFHLVLIGFFFFQKSQKTHFTDLKRGMA